MTRCRCREATNGGGRGRRVCLSLCSDRASRRTGATSAAAAAALSLSLCSERAQATARQAKAAARWRQPSPSPPSGPRRRHDRLYFTSLRVVCGTYEDCRAVPAILRLLRAASDGSGRPRRLFPAAPPLPRLLELGEAGVLTAAVEEQRRRRPGREQVLRESGARWAEVVGPPATVARRGASLPPLDLGEPRLSPSVGELLEDPAAPRFPLKASCRSQCSPWFRDSHHMSTRVCANSPLDCYPTCQLPRSFISDSTEIPICAAAMRLGCRAIFSLVRSSSSSTTTTTSAASSPPAVLSVGHALRERRRFTEADVAAYAAVSGDRNPVHLDAAAARELGGFHGGRVVHGMLVASLFPSIIAARFPGAVYASQTLKFAAPVYVGDDVVAQVQALHIRATTTANSSTSSRYVVKFATKCFADEEEGSLVIEGEAMALLPTLELSSESTSKE